MSRKWTSISPWFEARAVGAEELRAGYAYDARDPGRADTRSRFSST
jgi:hypothetical protein